MLVIATSGPSSTYPQRAYRNPTDELVKFLDYKHGSKWSIWEFRAEGTGYPDEEVHNRIQHYPWPDHHPPPFALIPNIMASMRDWLKGPEVEMGRVVVVHCKAGKGRSGTIACSYLISEEGWSMEDALARFTARRMRSGFGDGISIPSQQRWIKYVHWWTKHGKLYEDRQIEILEVHVWGLRDGVKVAVEGFVDAGRVIKTFHTFSKDERTILMDEAPLRDLTSTIGKDLVDEEKLPHHNGGIFQNPSSSPSTAVSTEPKLSAAVFRPSTPIILPTPDINIDFERRNKAAYGFTMVTSVAHVWFNAFFESQFSSRDPSLPNLENDPASIDPLPDSGIFSIAWEAMDGIRGSARKGTRALDRLSVVWRAVTTPEASRLVNIITEPQVGEPVPETGPADWRKANLDSPCNLDKDLGLRTDSPARGLSKASSVKSGSTTLSTERANNAGVEGVKTRGPDGEGRIPYPQPKVETDLPLAVLVSEPACVDSASSDGRLKPEVDLGMEKAKSPASIQGMGLSKVVNAVDGMRARRNSDEEIKGMEKLREAVEHIPGQVAKEN